MCKVTYLVNLRVDAHSSGHLGVGVLPRLNPRGWVYVNCVFKSLQLTPAHTQTQFLMFVLELEIIPVQETLWIREEVWVPRKSSPPNALPCLEPHPHEGAQ